MTKLVFSPEARDDLSEIGDYIAFKLLNKSAARKQVARIQDAVFMLRQFPEFGTPLDCSGKTIRYRYLVCDNYMVYYYLTDVGVYIDRILYGRRDYLRILYEDKLNEELV